MGLGAHSPQLIIADGVLPLCEPCVAVWSTSFSRFTRGTLWARVDALMAMMCAVSRR